MVSNWPHMTNDKGSTEHGVKLDPGLDLKLRLAASRRFHG